MDFLELMTKRYTCKHYDASKKISDSDFNKIKECLRLTPSAVNLQGWQFYVAHTDEQKKKMRDSISDFNQGRFDECSHAIFICANKRVTEDFYQKVLAKEKSDKRILKEELLQAQYASRKGFTELNSETEKDLIAWCGKQCYIALATAMYAAESMGIDTTAVEGFDAKKVDAILDLDKKDLTCQVVLFLGYRSDKDSNVITNRPKSRLDLEDIFVEI